MKSFILMALMALATTASASHDDIKFEVQLTGAANKVKTKASGQVKFQVDLKKQTITGTLKVKNIKGVTWAHFHVGAAFVNGPIAAYIWPLDGNTKLPTTQPFDTSDWTVPFTIKAADLVDGAGAPLPLKFKDLVQAMIKGNIYANVHTLKNPGGEIRGQTQRHS